MAKEKNGMPRIEGVEWDGDNSARVTIPIEQTNASGYDLTVLEVLGIASSLEDRNSKRIERRLAQWPGGVKEYRMMSTLLSKTILRLKGTMPAKAQDYVEKAWKYGAVSITFPGAAPGPAWGLIRHKDLSIIILSLLDSKCGMCTCDRAQAKNCPLRPILKVISPAKNGGDSTGCEYQLVSMGINPDGIEGVDGDD